MFWNRKLIDNEYIVVIVYYIFEIFIDQHKLLFIKLMRCIQLFSNMIHCYI